MTPSLGCHIEATPPLHHNSVVIPGQTSKTHVCPQMDENQRRQLCVLIYNKTIEVKLLFFFTGEIDQVGK